MSAALSIDFGNSYTKVGIRKDRNETSRALRSDIDLDDEDHICIPTVAARVMRGGKETWLYGTQVKAGSKGSNTQVFRNWKPRFFGGGTPSPSNGFHQAEVAVESSPTLDKFTDDQLQTLIKAGMVLPATAREIMAVLERRKFVPKSPEEDCDFEEIGRGYFAWLRDFVEPFCTIHGIGTTRDIPVRITLPSFGENSAQARVTLEKILRKTGWKPAVKHPTLAEPVANLIGTFSGGRNSVSVAHKIGSPKISIPESYHLQSMIGDSTLFRAIRSFANHSGRDRRSFYWVMIADLGGFTTDFAMVGFDLDDVEIRMDGSHEGKRILGNHSDAIGVHELDKEVREALDEANRKGFDSLVNDADGKRLDNFHRMVYQDHRPYDTGQGTIGKNPEEKKRIEEVIRRFADRVAESARSFLLREQYDHIDELILTGGGCNIPLVREAVRQKLECYNLKRSYIPIPDLHEAPSRCQRLERTLVRGATALGGTSVFFDYD